MAFSHPFFLIVRFSRVHGSCLLRPRLLSFFSLLLIPSHRNLPTLCCSIRFPHSPLFWWVRRGESWRRVRPTTDDLDCRGGGKRECWSGYGQTFGEKGEGGCHVMVLKRVDESVQNGVENEVKNDEKYKQIWRKMEQKTKRNK